MITMRIAQEVYACRLPGEGMAGTALTKRQQAIYQYLQRFLDEHGFPPTLREIARHFRLAGPMGVKRHLDTLVRKGVIQRLPGQPRAIRIKTPPLRQDRLLPILGGVHAGLPLLSEENMEGQLLLDSMIAARESAFVLRVKGESMIDAHIVDGDYVVVQKEQTVENGEMAVVLVDGEATLKYFTKRKKEIILSPAHPEMKPIIVRQDQSVQVLGRVVAVLRMVDAGSKGKKNR